MNRRRLASVVVVVQRSAAVLAVAALGTLPLLAQSVNDPALRVEIVIEGLSAPTAMAFIPPPWGAPGEFLVLQKNDGRVLRFGGNSPGVTVLDVPVNSASERGLLGLALDPNFVFLTSPYVYLHYTESSTGADTGDATSTPLGNRVYRYTWDPSTPGFLRDPRRGRTTTAGSWRSGRTTRSMRSSGT